MKGVAYQNKKSGLSVPPEHKDDSPLYTEGQEVEVSESAARHFTNRGVAEVVKPKSKVEEEPKPKAAPVQVAPKVPDNKTDSK